MASLEIIICIIFYYLEVNSIGSYSHVKLLEMYTCIYAVPWCVRGCVVGVCSVFIC